MELFVQQLVAGIAVGCVYALIAIGYTMVYGILKFINFAHGAVYMVGAYVGLLIMLNLQPLLPLSVAFFLALLISMAVAASLGMFIERVAYRPLRGRSRLTSFLTSLGASIFLTYSMESVMGPAPRPMPQLFPGKTFQIGQIYISYLQITILVISVVLMLLVHLFVIRTREGRAIRAISEDDKAARLMGINLDHSISLTFAIGSALGAIAGVLIGMYYDAVYPTMGWIAGLKGFIAAVLGGIGSLPGALLGGLLLGLSENLAAGYIASGWRDAIAFTVLIVVMLLRPEGIISRFQR